jgi:hypothetical protein
MKFMLGIAVTLAALCSATAAVAADRAELDPITLRGNRALPKVLYLVPWRPPAAGDLVGKPVESLLDETLSPVDRDVFRRQVEYYNLSHTPDGGAAGAAP